MQVREAQNTSTAHTGAALQNVHAPTALVTVCRQFGVAKDAEFRHGSRDVPRNGNRSGVVESKVIHIIPARARTFITRDDPVG
jgi:hypothetical protein